MGAGASAELDRMAAAARAHWLGAEGKSAHTVDGYARDVRDFLAFSKKMDGGRAAVEKWVARLAKDGVAARSVARKLAALRAFYVFALAQGWVDDNPVMLVARPKVGRSLPKALTAREMKKLLEAVEGARPEQVRLRLMLQLVYACGLRVSELVGLTLEQAHAAIEQGFLQVTGKGGKTRMVPVGSVALGTLQVFVKEIRPDLLGAGRGDWLFPSPRGGALTRQRVFQLVQALGESCGVKVAPHHLRHTFATHMLDNDADLRAVQVMLGHASLNTTQIYTKVAGKRLVDAVERYHPLSKTR